jgi:hypothetical protein
MLIVVGGVDFWPEELLVVGVGVRRRGRFSVERHGVFRALGCLGADNVQPDVAGQVPRVTNDQ